MISEACHPVFWTVSEPAGGKLASEGSSLRPREEQCTAHCQTCCFYISLPCIVAVFTAPSWQWVGKRADRPAQQRRAFVFLERSLPIQNDWFMRHVP